MSAKYSFTMTSQDRRRALPHKIILGRREMETEGEVLLKLLGFLLFHRPRLQVETRLEDDNIPFVPDLAEVDYELRPVLWVECGECEVKKLDRLAVKVPQAEIWVLVRGQDILDQLMRAMAKAELRRQRYHLLAFDHEAFDEMLGRLKSRNELLWMTGEFDPPGLQMDFNGLWFEFGFEVREF